MLPESELSAVGDEGWARVEDVEVRARIFYLRILSFVRVSSSLVR
jgi:hypothetical protein